MRPYNLGVLQTRASDNHYLLDPTAILYGDTPERWNTEQLESMKILEAQVAALGDLKEWDACVREHECGLEVGHLLAQVRQADNATEARLDSYEIDNAGHGDHERDWEEASQAALEVDKANLIPIVRKALVSTISAQKNKAAEQCALFRYAQDAAIALIAQGKISQEHFNTLYGPWSALVKYDL